MMIPRILLAAAALAVPSSVAHAQSIHFLEDFELGLNAWLVSHPMTCMGLPCSGGVTWDTITEDSDCSSWLVPFPSGFDSARFGHPSRCDFVGDNMAIPTGDMMSSPISLPVGGAAIMLRFWSASEADDTGWDRRLVLVHHAGLPAPVEVASLFNSGWQQHTVDLTAYAGNNINLIFRFQSLDNVMNTGAGWFIDDVIVESVPAFGFCFGDGSGAACPCGNSGAAGHGCASSIDPAGARLTSTGTPQVSADTLVLGASGLSNSVVLFFQGTQQQSGGQGAAFGDGLRCAGGSIVRLAAVQASGGVANYPGVGQVPVNIKGGVPGGVTRTYQVWYRNAAPFCTPSTFNLTNGLFVSWTP